MQPASLMIKEGSTLSLLPRVIRHKDASDYLGVNVNYFNEFIRPDLTEIQYGPQMIAFDRCELDEWFDNYKLSNGRPGTRKENSKPCRQKNRKSPVSSCEATPGGLTKGCLEKEFAKAVAQATTKRQ